ncbi:hypothetical protein [Selenomonas dianae]|uniref:Uncharacterized protein n=1 Tax=Selenomonas dianae TaxID=135079 RepID=A0ABP3CY19_9FIRM|nr:hypothetical protein [Selenomonas dianae]WLD82609.1 hypothetical protein QU667_01075 [Selenomonas dianae]
MTRVKQMRREAAQKRIAVLVKGKAALMEEVRPALSWEENAPLMERYQALYDLFNDLIQVEATTLAAL